MSEYSPSRRPVQTTMLLLLLVSVAQASIDIYAKDHTMVQDKAPVLGGAAPPPPTALTSSYSSCSCSKLLLSSLGPAATYQPNAMGIYTK